MKNLGKIAGFNIAFIVIYGTLFRVSGTDSLSVMLYSMALVTIQVLFNVIMAISYSSHKDPQTGRSYALTALLVLIIGFGVCVAPVPSDYHHANYNEPANTDTIHLPSSSHDSVPKVDTTVADTNKE